jgi:hypothetical protein
MEKKLLHVLQNIRAKGSRKMLYRLGLEWWTHPHQPIQIAIPEKDLDDDWDNVCLRLQTSNRNFITLFAVYLADRKWTRCENGDVKVEWSAMSMMYEDDTEYHNDERHVYEDAVVLDNRPAPKLANGGESYRSYVVIMSNRRVSRKHFHALPYMPGITSNPLHAIGEAEAWMSELTLIKLSQLLTQTAENSVKAVQTLPLNDDVRSIIASMLPVWEVGLCAANNGLPVSGAVFALLWLLCPRLFPQWDHLPIPSREFEMALAHYSSPVIGIPLRKAPKRRLTEVCESVRSKRRQIAIQ